MKTVLKQISLLLWSGLIIPFCCTYTTGPKPAGAVVYVQKSTENTAPDNQGEHFSFMHDVAAKLLPVVNFLN